MGHEKVSVTLSYYVIMSALLIVAVLASYFGHQALVSQTKLHILESEERLLAAIQEDKWVRFSTDMDAEARISLIRILASESHKEAVELSNSLTSDSVASEEEVMP